ncbi:response regulator [Cohnella candidum]|uniref:Response regulator n=1 Tax=Cohnella candidum TaxID=2674991 RepID=A0A3G3K007_9BACL|nr:response regulator [Cohnella candidum]AYQ73457.1 response regulator [Cohnella candidum]
MKILIADDEAIFRDYLKQALDWAAYGFSICGEARNGEEALELAERTAPDLALVDINMPNMDGLTLTERLKAVNPRMDVIIITGHNEFDYARTAIRLGVEDYILKPFSKDELVLTLLKCRQKHRDSLEALQTEKADRQLMAESMLNRLVSGEAAEPAERIASRLGQLGVSLGLRHGVACIEIDHMERRWNEPAERQLWKFAVANILQETMEEDGQLHVFHGPEGHILCLRKENGAPGRAAQNSVEAYEKVCRYIRKYLKLTVTIGLGTGHDGIEGIRRSYGEARQALRNKFTLGEDRVIAFEALDSKGEGTAFPADTNEQLAHQLRIGDWPSLDSKLDELFRIIRDRKLSLDLIYVACMGWVSVCLSHVTEAGHPIEDCFGEHFFPYSEIRTLETAENVKAWMKPLFRRAFDYVSRHKQTRASIIANTARQHIEEHYGDPDLSVEGVAARLFINPSYLRAVFKKTYGMTAGEYLIHVRMTKAKELIGGPLRLSDVAEKVGFSDPGYFSKSFRKFFGVPPSEYENAAKGART